VARQPRKELPCPTVANFLTTLGKALGATGLLLPLAGKGALAIPDLGKAAQLPVTVAPMPFSPEALRLREIRRELNACYLGQHDYLDGLKGYDRAWTDLMRNHYHPLVKRVIGRPPATWTHCVELAEIAWVSLAHKRSINDSQGSVQRPLVFGKEEPVEALIEAVLTLGRGDRFYWNTPREEVQS
jgi:hypothetical protein